MSNMTTERRRRGRPKGSTRYAATDAELLGRAADLMVRDETLSATAAIKQVIGRPDDESCIRRLRGKLQRDRQSYLHAAHRRVNQAQIVLQPGSQADARPAPTFGNMLIMLGGVANRVQEYFRRPHVQAFIHSALEGLERIDTFLKTPEGQRLLHNLSQLSAHDGQTARTRLVRLN